MENAELARQLQQAKAREEQLEQMVWDRTLDLQTANAKLEAAHRRLAAVAHHEQQAMNTQVRYRFGLQKEIEQGLRNGEFLVHYQPLIGIAERRISSLEALVRWNHPRRGFISPAEFIPVAEESGLILQLGEFVLRSVCEQVVRWEREQVPVVPVSVNVSAVQLQRLPMWKFVRRVLRDTGMRPKLLALEITESSLIKDAELSVKDLLGLQRDGIRIDIDDFGTGYSSLAYLKRLPIDTIKIDQSFIRQIDTDVIDEAIVSAVLGMARTLGLKVVAEGVETQAQFDTLRKHGCEIAQGYFFSRPLAADDCRKLLCDAAQRPSFTETLRMIVASRTAAA